MRTYYVTTIKSKKNKKNSKTITTEQNVDKTSHAHARYQLLEKYSRAIAWSRVIMAGDPGGLLGDITPGTPLCCTVIVCLKSDGKLMFEPGSFFSSLNLDLLNLPVNTFFSFLFQHKIISCTNRP